MHLSYKEWVVRKAIKINTIITDHPHLIEEDTTKTENHYENCESILSGATLSLPRSHK